MSSAPLEDFWRPPRPSPTARARAHYGPMLPARLLLLLVLLPLAPLLLLAGGQQPVVSERCGTDWRICLYVRRHHETKCDAVLRTCADGERRAALAAEGLPAVRARGARR